MSQRKGGGRKSGSYQKIWETMSGKGDINSTPPPPFHTQSISKLSCPRNISQGIIHTAPVSEPLGGACWCADFRVLLQMKGILLSWSASWIQQFWIISQAIFKKRMLPFKNNFPTLFRPFHVHSSCLGSGPTVSPLNSSRYLLTGPQRLLCQPQSPPSPCLFMLNSHDFQTLMLVSLSNLLSYDISLTLDPSHCHAPSPIPQTSQVPSPHSPPLLLSFPLPPIPFPFLATRQTQALALSPVQLPPPLWSPSVPSLHSPFPISFSQRTLFKSSTEIYMLCGTYTFTCLSFPPARQRGSTIMC